VSLLNRRSVLASKDSTNRDGFVHVIVGPVTKRATVLRELLDKTNVLSFFNEMDYLAHLLLLDLLLNPQQ
jgi:hypothetical protein